MKKNYKLTDDGLSVPDPREFGIQGEFEIGDLGNLNSDFEVALDAFDHLCNEYTIHSLVLRHRKSGRCFRRLYAKHAHEPCGWFPRAKYNGDWTEVVPVEVTRVEFELPPLLCDRSGKLVEEPQGRGGIEFLVLEQIPSAAVAALLSVVNEHEVEVGARFDHLSNKSRTTLAGLMKRVRKEPSPRAGSLSDEVAE